jgi:radical SAM PhpK family P-methyltransferase
MGTGKHLDCVVIGYNETPFEKYETILRDWGEDSEAYRDLKFSFVNLEGRKLDYISLLNHSWGLAHNSYQNIGGRKEFESGDIPNLAAVYLTWFLRKAGLAAKYINLFQSEKSKLEEYLADDPYCVAVTTTFYLLNFPVNEIVEFVRSRNPRVKIVVGGPLVANHLRNYSGRRLEEVLQDMGADYYVADSQGELTLRQIVECLRNKGEIGSVPNLIYFSDGKMTRTQTLPENNSLDENYIDWSGFPDEDLGRTIQTRTARSCAFSCSFCNYPGRAGKLTLADTSTFEKELNSIRGLGSVENLVFIDDTFNVPLERFKEMCRMMINKGYQFNWFSYFRCSNSDEEAIDLMAQSGCRGVFLGIESGSPSILKNMNKAATIEKYEKGIRLLHERGILTFGSFILGFPGETAETIKETTDFIRKTAPTYYRTQMWYCEPGTPIDRQREKHKISGKGFVWNHATMESMEAMDHIEKMFLSISESQWLPQWSFDFWIIPYLLGKGISLNRFGNFMAPANKMLALEIASPPESEKAVLQQKYKQEAVDALRE